MRLRRNAGIAAVVLTTSCGTTPTTPTTTTTPTTPSQESQVVQALVGTWSGPAAGLNPNETGTLLMTFQALSTSGTFTGTFQLTFPDGLPNRSGSLTTGVVKGSTISATLKDTQNFTCTLGMSDAHVSGNQVTGNYYFFPGLATSSPDACAGAPTAALTLTKQ